MTPSTQSNSSTLTLSFPSSSHSISFSLTSASITESFDDILKVECEAYYEGLESTLNEILSQMKDFFYAKLSLSLPIASKRINLASPLQNFSLVGDSLQYLHKSKKGSNSLNQKFFFSFVLYSPLHLLKHNTSSRIFSSLTPVEVITSILASYAPFLRKEVDTSFLQGSYPAHDYLTQYKEDDLSFIQRLCASSGIFLLEREDKLYLCDNAFVAQGEESRKGYEALIQTHSYPLNDNPNNPLNQECFSHLQFSHSLSFKSTLHSSFAPSHPHSLQHLSSASIHSDTPTFSSLTHFPSYSLSSNAIEERESSLSALREQMENYLFHIQSNLIALKLGDKAQIKDISKFHLPSYLQDKNSDYQIVAITHHFKDKANLVSEGGINEAGAEHSESSYHNCITLLPSSIPFFPSARKKPNVSGGLLGLVIGESKEEEDLQAQSQTLLDSLHSQKNTIHTDSEGRIRTIFAYSLSQALLDSKRFSSSLPNQSLTSCYLRVLAPIASNNAGFFALPRIGDEVLIQFLEGDCDKPIIAGSFYNASSSLPHNTESNYHYTSLSASTIGVDHSSQRSEITLKTLQDQEEIYLFSQKDYRSIVSNDDFQEIRRNKQTDIKGSNTTRTSLADIEVVGGLKDINVGAESIESVGLFKNVSVGGGYTLNVGENYTKEIKGECRENIEGNKQKNIKGNQEENIEGDKVKEIKGDEKHKIVGEYDLNVEKGIYVDVQKQMDVRVKEGLFIKNKFASIESEEDVLLKTKTHILELEKQSTQAKDSIDLKVQDGMIEIKSDKIIIKAGGVEASISKDGLVVKGGEIKSE